MTRHLDSLINSLIQVANWLDRKLRFSTVITNLYHFPDSFLPSPAELSPQQGGCYSACHILTCTSAPFLCNVITWVTAARRKAVTRETRLLIKHTRTK